MIIDLCAGPGGWDEALRMLGITDVLGIEIDSDACATRAAAGHATLQGDMASLIPHAVVWPASCSGLIGSPPCPSFSQAGNRVGMLELEHLVAHVHAVADGWMPYEAPANLGYDEEFGEPIPPDPRSALVLEPLRWTDALKPPWVVLEQVPPVLPVWEAMGVTLGRWGYSVWTGVLNAADFGVPQTRQRAILIARRDGQPAHPPEPTHCRGGAVTLLGELQPWVSMAQALGWGMDARPYPTVVGGHAEPTFLASNQSREIVQNEKREGRWVGFPRRDDLGTSEDGYRERDWRSEDEPAQALTEKSRSWVVRTGNATSPSYPPGERPPAEEVQYRRDIEEPAPTVGGRADLWHVEPEDLVVNTGRDWQEGGTRDDAQKVPLTEPAPSIDTKGRWRLELAEGVVLNPGRTDSQPNRRTYGVDEPAPTVAFGHDASSWAWERPATTVQGDPRNWPPGHKINADDERRLGADEAAERYGDRAGTEAIRLDITDALVLQSFRRDYPVQGSKTSQFGQVGNAVPPLLGACVLSTVIVKETQ